MTTLVDLTHASMSAQAVSSFGFGPNAYMRAEASSSTNFTSSVSSGGTLFRDGIMSAQSVSSFTVAGVRQRAASMEAEAQSSMSVNAGDGAVGFLLPLSGLSGDYPYGAVVLPPGLLPGGNGTFEPGEAGSYLHPLTSSSSGPLPVPGYAFATGSLAPLIGDAYMLTGQIGSVDEGELSPLHGLSGDYPYGGVTLPPSLQPGGDGTFVMGEAGSFLHPLVGAGYDPGGPVDNGDGTFTYTAYASEVMFTADSDRATGAFAIIASNTLNVADVATPGVTRFAILTETLRTQDSGTALAAYIVALTEVVQVQSNMTRTEYATWVMNTRNEANSIYDGFEFDSLVTHRGRTFAAGPGGLFELTGDDDNGNPIVASVLLDKTDFGTSYRKGMEGAYLGGHLPDGLHVRVVTDDGRSRTYEAKQTPRLATRRVALGKGLLSRYYQLEITNPEGQDFTLDTMELVPVTTKRRR